MKVFWFFAPGYRFSKKNSARGWWGGRAQKKDSASF
jgi:hypothetical protein